MTATDRFWMGTVIGTFLGVMISAWTDQWAWMVVSLAVCYLFEVIAFLYERGVRRTNDMIDRVLEADRAQEYDWRPWEDRDNTRGLHRDRPPG
jgi:hypothetical protein